MKRYLLFITATLFTLYACKKDECINEPVMGETTLIEVGYSSISVSGKITSPTCESSVISQGIVIGIEQLPTINNSKKTSSGTNFQLEFTELKPKTTYYLRTFYEDNYGVYYGKQLIATTQNPTIKFNDYEQYLDYTSISISTSYSFLEGSGVNVDKKGVYFDNLKKYDDQSSDGQISVEIGGLEINTEHIFQAFVETKYGEYTSDEISLSTLDPSSNVDVPNISNLSYTSASLESAYTNSYSGEDLTQERGFYISLNEDMNEKEVFKIDESSQDFTLNLEGLQSNTNYFATAYIVNDYGTYISNVISFSTQNAGYSFSNNLTSNIYYDSADISIEFQQISSEVIEIIQKGVYVSENENMSNPILILSDSSNGIISNNLNNLTTGKKYFYYAFVKNTYGEFKSSTYNFVTLNATPDFSLNIIEGSIDFDKINTGISIIKPSDVDLLALNIELKREFDGNTKNIDYLAEVNTEFNGGSFEYSFENLSPKNRYLVKISTQTAYGNYISDEYVLTTKDDTPFMHLQFINHAENAVTAIYNIHPAEGDETLEAIWIEYKNQEEDNYKIVNLPSMVNNTSNYLTDNQSAIVDGIIQGPQYEYRLRMKNKWNTHTETVYEAKKVEYKVGDIKFGGVIVYIDGTGYHGLIAAEPSNYKLFKWADGIETSNDLFCNSDDGYINSMNIKDYYSNIPSTSPALDYCLNFTNYGYNDWYLPSKDELIKAQTILWNVYSGSVMSPVEYNWTSTTIRDSDKAIARFENGCSGNNCLRQDNKNLERFVMPVRKF